MHTAWRIRDGDLPAAPNTLAQTTDGYLWLGTSAGLLRFDGIRFQRPASAIEEGQNYFAVYALHGSADRSLWIGTGRSVYKLKSASFSSVASHVGHVNQIISDSTGNVWFARTRNIKGGGLCEIQGERVRCFGEQEGLDRNRGNAVAPDGVGGFWVGFNQSDPGSMVHPQFFGAGDGVRSMATDFQPHSTVSSDGRIWFGGLSGVQVIDPANLHFNQLIPPVHVERLLADGIDYRDGQRLRQPIKNIEIDYTGLSLTNPQQVQFRFRLWDFDNSWQEGYTRRQAFYQNLPPGTYRFQVLASNDDGVWNDKGDTITFIVPLAFYQTVWFRALVVIAVLSCIWIFIRVREMRAAEAFKARMNERLMERDRIARELHDTLLQGFQSIVLRFQVGVNAIQPPQRATEMLQGAIERADAALKEGRDRVKGLRRGRSSLKLADELKDSSTIKIFRLVSFAGWKSQVPSVSCRT